jgi:hypothetical protein
MKSADGARVHVAAQRRGLRAKIRGDVVALYEGERRVFAGGPDAAREFLKKQDMTAKARREIARLKRKREPSRKLKRDDAGIESHDHTPEDARGLVLTDVMLPKGVTADLGLVSLWVLENTRPSTPARAIISELAAAERVLATEGRRSRVWLSDHDRASLARYATSQ